MKREIEFAETLNSPSKSKQIKVYSGAFQPKFTFLSEKTVDPEQTISSFLEWKKQWNSFLVKFLCSLVSNENDGIDISSQYERLSEQRNTLRKLNVNHLEASPHAEAILASLQQCDNFDPNLRLNNNQQNRVASILKSLKSCDNIILGNYQCLELLGTRNLAILEDLSNDPLYREYQELCDDLEKDILPELNNHLQNISAYPDRLDKRAAKIKPSPVMPFLVSLLQDRKVNFIQQLEKFTAHQKLILRFIIEIKRELEKCHEFATQICELETRLPDDSMILSQLAMNESESYYLLESSTTPGKF
jgi:hypothetical protein